MKRGLCRPVADVVEDMLESVPSPVPPLLQGAPLVVGFCSKFIQIERVVCQNKSALHFLGSPAMHTPSGKQMNGSKDMYTYIHTHTGFSI